MPFPSNALLQQLLKYSSRRSGVSIGSYCELAWISRSVHNLRPLET
jgi:hypothetical protein